ncbi:Nucleoside-diphosphate-sugar epimerase [Pedobacter antarcticus]|nr:NAD-dependent epimerase/dehydratase family protein [Pedobacter antarcticus]SFF12670.1 Nucleoside-diphosphate-sugar epimerase [Pedobacter antarcticus]
MILLTGHSGFLGTEIKKNLQAQIVTLGRGQADIQCDLSKSCPELPAVDLVIHSAGKAHSVPKTAEEKQSFFDVNVKGTIHLLNALIHNPPKSFVFISSVAVYGKDSGIDISENEPLAATEPYGSSKIEAEEIVKEWCDKNHVSCAILRLPLIAGPNPPGNLGAMIKGVAKGYYLNIAGGKARKSVVLAQDVALIIEKAGQIGGTYNLTDGYNPSFAELSENIAGQLGKSKPNNIPPFIANLMGRIGDLIGEKSPVNTNKIRKITSDLTFNDSKAREFLKWKPTQVLEGFKIK